MSLKVKSDGLVYVLAPANAATGGPQLLHQLAWHLINDLKITTKMLYYGSPENLRSPVHKEYKKYGIPFDVYVDGLSLDNFDRKNNIIIVPEVLPGIQALKKFNKAKKVLWFLSVDNFVVSNCFDISVFGRVARYVNMVAQKLFSRECIDIPSVAIKYYRDKSALLIPHADLYFAQSYYAVRYLRNSLNVRSKIEYLSDYIDDDFININNEIVAKENIVLYNPKKGKKMTDRIIMSAPDIKFVPLSGLSRQQMIEYLKKAKVYIDFGNHPGKDRIPREAAILGCCVIVGLRGSASFYEDVPLPDEFKFTCSEKSLPLIGNKIRICLRDYENQFKKLEQYRSVIMSEKKIFLERLRALFEVVE